MHAVELDHLTIRFGSFTAVEDVDLKIKKGEFFSLLGPSGCGKTTILRAISGFLDLTEGGLKIAGKDMRGIGPNRRPTALIFQNLALFPLMSVTDNIAFGLEVRGMGKRLRRKKANELLELIALTGQGDKKIGELSGGQKQRVAIARALAVEPEVLLLDEPLSALDLKLRQHMRTELRAIQQKVGITFIYITHDQGEALTMSDRVAVMNKGIIQQIGQGTAIYDQPANAFVASFVGENNALMGEIAETRDDGKIAVIKTSNGIFIGSNQNNLSKGDRAILFIRPESLFFTEQKPADPNRFFAKLKNQEFEGSLLHFFFETKDGAPITMTVPNNAQVKEISNGSEVEIGFSESFANILAMGTFASD